MVLWLTKMALAIGIPAVSGVIQIEQPGEVKRGEQPVFTLRVEPEAEVVYYTECTAGDAEEKVTVISPVLPVGEAMLVTVKAEPPVVSAECLLVANFANGLSERRPATITWTWVEPGDEK